MAGNETVMQWNNVVGLYVATIVSLLSVIVSIFVCSIIIILTYITPNLRSPSNLLVSNTCLCTLIYSIISTTNTLIFYIELKSTDWSCRIRAYCSYVSLNLVIYSYVIQAISRLFWIVLYRHRYLLTNKCHFYLIISQISLCMLFPLSTLITEDIVFRPMQLCLISMMHKIHGFYLLTIGYIIPLTIVIILYSIIYYHIMHSTSNVQGILHRRKRDAELTRNILILLSIIIFGGFPIVIYNIVSNKIESVHSILFLLAVISLSIAVAVEKVMTIVLNKDIRKALKQRWIACFPNRLLSSTRVQPIPGVNKTVSEIVPMANVKKTEQKESDL